MVLGQQEKLLMGGCCLEVIDKVVIGKEEKYGISETSFVNLEMLFTIVYLIAAW